MPTYPKDVPIYINNVYVYEIASLSTCTYTVTTTGLTLSGSASLSWTYSGDKIFNGFEGFPIGNTGSGIDLYDAAMGSASIYLTVSELELQQTISKIKLPGSNTVYDIKDSALTSRVSNLETTISSSLQKGVANGVAELDSAGKVPSSQLPSYVDDVLEYSSQSSFPATGETGKIYIALDTNKTYRWSGSAYTEISASLALGETSSTAYRGDRGKTAYDHSQTTSGNPHNVTKSDIGLGNVDNTSDATKKTNFTGSIASGNTGFITGGDAYTAISAKYTKPSTGIPASDLASGVIPSVPSATTTTPKMDGTAAVGSETKWAKGDHVHPTDTSRLSTTGNAYRAVSIPMGQCDSTSTSTAFTATVTGITELRDGVCMWLKNGVVTSAAGFTININSLGAKPCYGSLAAETQSTTVFNINYTMLFIYNSSRVTGGCWDIVYGYDSNTTYTNVKLGQGYATCSTAAATVAKTAALSSYTLTANGIVSIKFTNDVPANATLNINSKGAKAIYYRGAKITSGIIKAGDTATFIYNTYYHLISIDQVGGLPTVTASDNGKVLMVTNGAWAAASLPLFEGTVEEQAELISFTVKLKNSSTSTTYYAEDGMTWGEWVASEYNTDGFVNNGIIKGPDNLYCALIAETVISSNELIIANGNYFTDHFVT